jgi:uncharacterized protein (AIM24 family)
MDSVNAAVESAYSLERFLGESYEKRTGERFEAESERMLRIDVDGGVWLKPGAAIGYRGEIAFERLPTIDANSLTDAALREMTPLVRATGHGRLYCGHHGSFVRLVRLAGETIVVSWQELLAFDESLEFEMAFVAHGISIAAGGLVVVKLSGHGAFAIAVHGDPLTLAVDVDKPVSTDPHATLAWSGSLTPSLKTDLSWRSVFRHGGQEPFQMFFEGTGFVVVQPYKDPSRIALSIDPLNQIRALLTGL